MRAAAADSATTGNAAIGFEPFQLDPPSTSFETNYFYNSSRVTTITSPGVPNSSKTIESYDYGLQELLKLGTTGFLFSPNVFTANLDGTLGMEERWYNEQNGQSNQILSVYDYNFLGTLAPHSDSPVTFKAIRTNELTSQPFSETYRSIANNYDVAWTLKA